MDPKTRSVCVCVFMSVFVCVCTCLCVCACVCVRESERIETERATPPGDKQVLLLMEPETLKMQPLSLVKTHLS